MRHHFGVFVLAALLAAGCGPTSSLPAPTAGMVAATKTLPSTAATMQPPTAVADATPNTEASPTNVAFAQVAGETVIQLTAGEGQDQVGIVGDAGALSGPKTFRIGSDNSIRLLDSERKRLLFFTPEGKLRQVIPIEHTWSVTDFIVANSGEIYVLATTETDGKPVILHYGPKGALAEQIPLSLGVGMAANGIMLTADNTLMLVDSNRRSWMVRYQDTLTPPAIQPTTQQLAVPTPRSPTLFTTSGPHVSVLSMHDGVFQDLMTTAAMIEPNLPETMSFFNIDRAMNLYLTSDPTADQVDIARVAPDGAVLGGVRIDQSTCDTALRSWRSIYVDQTGIAWGMCTTANKLTITRYTLEDSHGQALAQADEVPADVVWKPGANFNAA